MSNTGIIDKLAIKMTLDGWNGILAVNVIGAFLFCREAVRLMTAAKSGAIANVGTYACYQTFPKIAA